MEGHFEMLLEKDPVGSFISILLFLRINSKVCADNPVASGSTCADEMDELKDLNDSRQR